MPRGYQCDKFSPVVRESVSTEAEESPLLEAVTRERPVETQQTKKLSVCCSGLQGVEISDGAIIKCSHESCVKVVNKPNYQPKSRLKSRPLVPICM
jgi:hypothetical protein